MPTRVPKYLEFLKSEIQKHNEALLFQPPVVEKRI